MFRGHGSAASQFFLLTNWYFLAFKYKIASKGLIPIDLLRGIKYNEKYYNVKKQSHSKIKDN